VNFTRAYVVIRVSFCCRNILKHFTGTLQAQCAHHHE
jgi:hypothetical protein